MAKKAQMWLVDAQEQTLLKHVLFAMFDELCIEINKSLMDLEQLAGE